MAQILVKDPIGLPEVIRIKDSDGTEGDYIRPCIKISNLEMYTSARYIKIEAITRERPHIIILNEGVFGDLKPFSGIMVSGCKLPQETLKEINPKGIFESTREEGYDSISKEAFKDGYWEDFILPMCTPYEGRKIIVQNQEENRFIADATIIKDGKAAVENHLFFEIETQTPEDANVTFVYDENSRRERFENEPDRKKARDEEYQYDKLNFIQFHSCVPTGEFFECINLQKVRQIMTNYLCIQGSAVPSYVWKQLLDAIRYN